MSQIERQIQVLKERFRALWHRLPFKMWPRTMIINGLRDVTKWLNAFPPKGGLSAAFSPRTIITGHHIDYEKHCKISFGSYVQAFTQNNPTNTVEERCIDGIFLRTLENIQGGYEVLNLKTGQNITRHKVTVIPTPPEVIQRVEQLASRDGFKP